MMNTGRICLLIIISICIFASSATVAEKRYFSIREIRKQGDELLRTAGNTGKIEICTARGNYPVTIEIPEVNAVPILMVTHPDYDQRPSQPENSAVEEHSIGGTLLGWNVSMQQDALFGEFVKNTTRVGQYGLNAQADGSPYTMADAISYADQILKAYEGQGWKYGLHRFYSMSCRYRAEAGRNGFESDLNKPVSDTGYYTLEYDQILYGIPYCGRVLFPYPGGNDRKSPSYEGFCIFNIFSAECWSYTLYAADQTKVLENDVPLCDIGVIVETLKKTCQNTPGTPASLRFVYKAWDDPENPEGDLVLLPMWILESDDGPDCHGAQMACINAQTGELVEESNKDSKRYYAVWFRWKDI